MKITKRLFAIAVAVLMLAAMIIPAAAATIPTDNNTLTINGKAGFTASVYKIADFNTTTGAFSNAKSNDVMTALKAGFTGTEYTPTAALLTAANALTDATLGEAVKTAAFTTSKTTETWEDLAAGVYYVKWTGKPANVTKAQNSVFVLPYFQNDAWVQSVTIADTKVDTGAISDDKKFADAGEQALDVVTRSIGQNVNFVLTGSVPGSAATPATALWFEDTMAGGLKFNSSVQLAVKGVKANGDKQDMTVDTDYTLTPAESIVRTFKVSFTATQIAALYTKGFTGIEITYTATLTDDGVVVAGNGNPNTLTYHYENANTTFEDTKTKIVKTYDLKVKKVDANDTNTALGGASFKLYKDSVSDANLIAEKTTAESGSEKGIATFTGLGQGNYVIVESGAPEGYALNTKEFAVSIAADGTVTGNEVSGGMLIVPDPKVVLPNTGGAGTLLFTIGGIVLIAGAAVLLVIYKKKSAK